MGKVLISITSTKMTKLANISKDEVLAIGTKVGAVTFPPTGAGETV